MKLFALAAGVVMTAHAVPIWQLYPEAVYWLRRLVEELAK